jgi:phosphoglycolate phosphatase
MYKLVIFDFDAVLARAEDDPNRRCEPSPATLAFLARHFGLPEEPSDSMQLMPGAKALLRRLAGQGVVLAVVSAYPAAKVRKILGPEAAALVEHYACGAALFGMAAKVRKLVRRARVQPSDTLSIACATRHIEAARAAGVAAGAASWGRAARETLAARAPTLLFETPDEVAARLAA